MIPIACKIEQTLRRAIHLDYPPNDDDGGWVAIHQDITSQKRAEAELAHMARYDSLDRPRQSVAVHGEGERSHRTDARSRGECFAC